MPNDLKIVIHIVVRPSSTFESNMCSQKMILNVGVLTTNKMKLGFEARSQNTRIIEFIRQILIHGIVLYEISMLFLS